VTKIEGLIFSSSKQTKQTGPNSTDGRTRCHGEFKHIRVTMTSSNKLGPMNDRFLVLVEWLPNLS
jgi:hypothetical protein